MPPTVHIIAAILAKARSIPWVADYRDLWNGYPYLETRSALRTSLQLRLESSLIRYASIITAASPSIADSLQELHPDIQVEAIPNSFDPDEWAGVKEVYPSSFALCFAGQLYEGRRTPDLLFQAASRLRVSGDPAGAAVSFNFYGYGSEIIKKSAEQNGLEDRVVYHGVVDRGEALAAERSSAGLLHFIWDSEATKGELGSKFFEYLGAGRQMIVIGPPDGPLKPIIEALGIGSYASTEDECVAALREAYKRFISGKIAASTTLTSRYSAEEMARRFADVLNSVA